MLPESHRAALRAVAKLVLSAGIVGCGRAAEAPATVVVPAGSTMSDRADGPPPTGERRRCAADAGDEGSLGCCKALVKRTVFPTTRPESLTAPDLRVDAEVRACCSALVELPPGPDGRWTRSSWAGCCEAIGSMSGSCTPWGPPMPPAMTARAPVA